MHVLSVVLATSMQRLVCKFAFLATASEGSYRYSAGLMWLAAVGHSGGPQPGIAAAGATGTACRDGGLHQALRDWCLNLAAA